MLTSGYIFMSIVYKTKIPLCMYIFTYTHWFLFTYALYVFILFLLFFPYLFSLVLLEKNGLFKEKSEKSSINHSIFATVVLYLSCSFQILVLQVWTVWNLLFNCSLSQGLVILLLTMFSPKGKYFELKFTAFCLSTLCSAQLYQIMLPLMKLKKKMTTGGGERKKPVLFYLFIYF